MYHLNMADTYKIERFTTAFAMSVKEVDIFSQYLKIESA